MSNERKVLPTQNQPAGANRGDIIPILSDAVIETLSGATGIILMQLKNVFEADAARTLHLAGIGAMAVGTIAALVGLIRYQRMRRLS